MLVKELVEKLLKLNQQSEIGMFDLDSGVDSPVHIYKEIDHDKNALVYTLATAGQAVDYDFEYSEVK